MKWNAIDQWRRRATLPLAETGDGVAVGTLKRDGGSWAAVEVMRGPLNDVRDAVATY